MKVDFETYLLLDVRKHKSINYVLIDRIILDDRLRFNITYL